MSLVFHYPDAASPTHTFRPSKPPRFPIGRTHDYPRQVTGQTAAGTRLVQDLGGTAQERFELAFDFLPLADRDQARAFFDVVKKSAQTFEFIDNEGTTHTVRWLNPFDFRQAAHGRYSGTIELIRE
ncbi:MAG: hypothetical protein KC553_04425 [Nitrospina sp.]|nr:hypothetical protein [Nitrospina sp.]